MRVTVCELPDLPEALEEAWRGLVSHVRAAASELVLLPELPFARWFAIRRDFELAEWRRAVEGHEAWARRLEELAPAVVLGTRPVESSEGRFNEAFVREQGGGPRGVHLKRYLPDEPGFWEASWYARGSAPPPIVRCGPALASFQICTELWFLHVSRDLGKRGLHLLAAPRCTPVSSADKWLAAGRVAAVVSGAFCLSSNWCGPSATSPSVVFAGRGWITGPEGDVLAETSPSAPFVTRDLDLGEADRAKRTYPRYVVD